MPSVLSWRSVTALSKAFQKLGQPVPLSNLVVDENEVEFATGATEHPGAVLVVERAAVGPLGARVAKDVVLLRVQKPMPLVVGVGDLEGLVRRGGRGARHRVADRAAAGQQADQRGAEQDAAPTQCHLR